MLSSLVVLPHLQLIMHEYKMYILVDMHLTAFTKTKDLVDEKVF